MLKDIIVGILEGLARSVGIDRNVFAKTIIEAGEGIRDGDLIPDEAFGRAKDDKAILDELKSKFGG